MNNLIHAIDTSIQVIIAISCVIDDTIDVIHAGGELMSDPVDSILAVSRRLQELRERMMALDAERAALQATDRRLRERTKLDGRGTAYPAHRRHHGGADHRRTAAEQEPPPGPYRRRRYPRHPLPGGCDEHPRPDVAHVARRQD